MRTIVVAINNHKFASQFTMNNTHFIMEHNKTPIRVILHNSLLFRQTPDGIEMNADIIIDTRHVTIREDEIFYQMKDWENKVYVNRLLQKDTQRYLINQALAGMRNTITPDYKCLPIRRWSFDKVMTNGHSAQFGTDFEGRLVLKTKSGARGVGQVLFNTDDYNPLYIINTLKKIKGQVSETQTTMEMIKETLPLISMGGKESSILESLDHLSNPEQLYLEEMVDDITEEYRVLVSPNLLSFYPRNLENRDGYQQAIGSNGGMKKSVAVSEDIKLFVLRMISEINFEYGSLDLYVTKDGNMGVFEYSGQFAADGIHTSESSSIQQDLLTTIIKRHLNGESLNVTKRKE